MVTDCRKGLDSVSDRHDSGVSTYYSPTRKESVEKEAALKAEHCDDPAREMQFCARPLEKSAAEAAMIELFRISRN